jgi:uncharacterized protein (TIGR03086 family)
MSMDIVDLEGAARRLGEMVAGTADSELGRPTPCPSYTLGDLIEHLGRVAQAFGGAAVKATGPTSDLTPAGDASRLADGWRETIPADLVTMGRAWREPAAWEGTARIAGSDGPADIIGLSAASELVVHGWDVARARGQEYDPDPAAIDAARRFLSLFASPDAPAGPDVPFGPSREIPDDAPELDRVVALAGRDPSWSPA